MHPDPKQTVTTRPLVIAHRGDSAHAPENTLRAFERAAGAGADWIETDLQLTRDGEVVAFHDRDLERLTGHRGTLADLRYGQIATLRIRTPAGRRTESTPEKADSMTAIPRLTDILNGVGRRLPFYLELKSDGQGRRSARNRALLERCLGLVPASSHHALASFDLDLVRGAREVGRQAIHIASGPRDLEPCRDEELRALRAVSVAHRRVDATLAARLSRIGAHLWAWTVDDPRDIARLLDLGVEGICTNDVERAVAVLRERRK